MFDIVFLPIWGFWSESSILISDMDPGKGHFKDEDPLPNPLFVNRALPNPMLPQYMLCITHPNQKSHVPTKYLIYPHIIVSVPSAIPSFHDKFTFFLFHQLAPGPPEVYFFTCRSCWATQGGLVDPDPVWSCQNGWPCIASIITEWVYTYVYI